jgi:hypothetical protein
MRLGEWRKVAPGRDCMSNAVLAVLKPVLIDLGADADPECWVLWGEDPDVRYVVMVPTRAGLISTAVRVNTPGEGPRATGKLIRWARLQLSELSVEAAAGHRLVAVQVEGKVLKGVDVEADRISEFVRGLIAAVDGRDWQFPWDASASGRELAAPRRAAAPKAAAKTSRVAAKPAAKPATRPAAKPGPAAAQPAAKPATRPAATKPVAAKSAAKSAAAGPDAAASSGSRARPGPLKPAIPSGLIPVPVPAAPTRPGPQGSMPELPRIAPHPIFAPVATPPARPRDEEPTDSGDADALDRKDRKTKRPKTWAP